MKKLLITHTDLDGISPILLLKLTGEKFDFKTGEPSEIESIFEELKPTLDKYDQIYFTDLTVPMSVYEYINENNLNVLVFDHHGTHKDFADGFKYTTIEVELNGRKTCGTELFYEYLKGIYPTLKTKKIKEYVELVRQLDTYTFESDIPKKLENIRTVYGRDEFIKVMKRRLLSKKENFEFNAFEKKFIKLKQQEIENYLTKKNEQLKKYLINDKTIGVVFCEKYKSELGNYLCEMNPEIEFVVMIDTCKAISYRGIGNADVASFATIYGGGGHKLASGSPFNDEMRDKIVRDYFKGAKLIKDED